MSNKRLYLKTIVLNEFRDEPFKTYSTMELAEKIGLPIDKLKLILNALSNNGYLIKQKVGRRNFYSVCITPDVQLEQLLLSILDKISPNEIS